MAHSNATLTKASAWLNYHRIGLLHHALYGAFIVLDPEAAASAELLAGVRPYQLITPLLRYLHWLPLIGCDPILCTHHLFLSTLFKGWGPDSGGERPQLPQHPPWWGSKAAQVFTSPHNDCQRHWKTASCSDHCRRDQVDHQFPNWWDGSQLGRVCIFLPRLSHSSVAAKTVS